jgi:hypothetical protein
MKKGRAMILYLVKKYVAIAVALACLFALLPLILGEMSLHEAVPRAFFWSGFVAPVVLYIEFRFKKLWPLYHNLRLPEFLLLGLFSGFQVAASIGLWIWIR